ncbi:hypothetical protein GCM10018954_097250 [Kutzneria kofuensis]
MTVRLHSGAMFTVAARTLTEYFTADPAREPELRQVDKAIRAGAASLKRYLFTGTGTGRPGMSMTMIGYGTFQYRVAGSDEPIDWPMLGLALQKNYISLYVAAVVGDRYLVEDYAGKLGKAKVGRNMVRFAKAAELDQDNFAELLGRIDDGVRDGSIGFRYGRAKQG